jgi:hypothetical protein
LVTDTEEPAGDEPEAIIHIVQFSDNGLWRAVWSNRDGFVADFDSDSQAEILAWARERVRRDMGVVGRGGGLRPAEYRRTPKPPSEPTVYTNTQVQCRSSSGWAPRLFAAR